MIYHNIRHRTRLCRTAKIGGKYTPFLEHDADRFTDPTSGVSLTNVIEHHRA
jgi:hypothetical protein